MHPKFGQKIHENAMENVEKLLHGQPEAQQRRDVLQEELAKARTIGDIAAAYMKAVVPANAGVVQRQETERAVYAASHALILSFFKVMEETNNDPQALMQWLEGRMWEAQEYAAGQVNLMFMDRQH